MLKNQFTHHALPIYNKLVLPSTILKTAPGSSGFTQPIGVSTAATIDFIQVSDCPFCLSQQVDQCFSYCSKEFAIMIVRALYSKYAASQNYYFSKDVNEIISAIRGRPLILYKDIISFDEDQEFCKRFYRAFEYKTKLSMLTEYYKYHRDIPRLYMMPISITLAKYHDKRRKIEYVRITKMLNIPVDGKDQNLSQQHAFPIHQSLERLLDDLDETEFHQIVDDSRKKHQQQKINKIEQSRAKHNRNREQQNKQKANDLSDTIAELNFKLGEIINNSNYFETPYLKTEQNQSNSLLDQKERLSNDKYNLPRQMTNMDNPFKKKQIQDDPQLQHHQHQTEPHVLQVFNFEPKYSQYKDDMVKLHNLHKIDPLMPTQKQAKKNNEFVAKKEDASSITYTTRQRSNSKQITPQSSERQISQSKQIKREPSKSLISPSQAKKKEITQKTAKTEQNQPIDLLALLQKHSGRSRSEKEKNKPLYTFSESNKPKVSAKSIENTQCKKRTSSPMLSKKPVQQQTKTKDPIIEQLMMKLREGNSNLFQQLMNLTSLESQKLRKMKGPIEQQQQRVKFELSVNCATVAGKSQGERNKQASFCNLNQLLKPAIKERNNFLVKNTASASQSKQSNAMKEGPKTQRDNRGKRINSQNMESNMFHLNLEKVNSTNQRINTTRDQTNGECFNQQFQPIIQDNIFHLKTIRPRNTQEIKMPPEPLTQRQCSLLKQRPSSDLLTKSPIETSSNCKSGRIQAGSFVKPFRSNYNKYF